jgi:hypothetical protein
MLEAKIPHGARRSVRRRPALAVVLVGCDAQALIGLAVPGWPIGPWSRRTEAPEAAATRRDRNPAVRPGSVSYRDHRGTNGHHGHQRPKRNRRSTSVQLKQQAQRQLADQIVVLTVLVCEAAGILSTASDGWLRLNRPRPSR